MARRVPPVRLSRWQYAVMRSIALNQRLPLALSSQPNGLVVLIEELMRHGLVSYEGRKLSLSAMGRLALREHAGGKVPLIDVDRRWLLANSEVTCNYVIGSSLAKRLAQRVRTGR